MMDLVSTTLIAVLIRLETNIEECGGSAWSQGGPQRVNIRNGMYACEFARGQKLNLPLQDPPVKLGSELDFGH